MNCANEPVGATPTPALDRLGLTDAHRALLANQGFVSCEVRRGTCRYFKLRFREAGRQRVVYVGSDPAFAAQVADELKQLQSLRNRKRELDRLTESARRIFRQIKRDLQQPLDSRGFHFHGHAVRRRRAPLSPPHSDVVSAASTRSHHQGESNA